MNLNLPRLEIADGTIEGMKWLALIVMTGDHVNKYLFNATLPFLFELGRVAMPLFVFVLAYNLARPNSLALGAYERTMKRLGLFGLAALPICMTIAHLPGGWWPLNIMFTLLLLTATLYLIEQRTVWAYLLALFAFLVIGSSVEFWWPAIIFGIAIWWYCKQPNMNAVWVSVVSLALLGFVNGNQWALLIIPLIILSTNLKLSVPRMRWFFYSYYPLHMAALLMIRVPMSKAGYIFM